MAKGWLFTLSSTQDSLHCLSVNSQEEGSTSLFSMGLPGGIWMIWPTEPNGRDIVLLLNLRMPVEGPGKWLSG